MDEIEIFVLQYNKHARKLDLNDDNIRIDSINRMSEYFYVIDEVYEQKITQETKWLALSYLDIILSTYSQNLEEYNRISELLIFGCISIAIKMEELYSYILVDIFLDDVIEKYKMNIFKIEMKVLKILNYKCNILHPLLFIKLFLKYINRLDLIDVCEIKLTKIHRNKNYINKYKSYEIALAIIYSINNSLLLSPEYLNNIFDISKIYTLLADII